MNEYWLVLFLVSTVYMVGASMVLWCGKPAILLKILNYRRRRIFLKECMGLHKLLLSMCSVDFGLCEFYLFYQANERQVSHTSPNYEANINILQVWKFVQLIFYLQLHSRNNFFNIRVTKVHKNLQLATHGALIDHWSARHIWATLCHVHENCKGSWNSCEGHTMENWSWNHVWSWASKLL